MLKRLILGLVLGLLLGGVVAVGLVQGLGMTEFAHPVVAYLAAAATGALAGLFGGKPIWAADARIEAGLKALFGTLIAVGGMFALRQWAHVPLSLGPAGAGELGALPAASLPLIGAVLAGFFGLDNTPAPEGEAKGAVESKKAESRKRVANVEDEEALADADESQPSQRQRTRR